MTASKPHILLFVFLLLFPHNFLYAANTHAADFERSSSQWLSIDDASQSGLDITGDITVFAWVKPESLANNTSSGIVGKYIDDTGDSRSYFFTINRTGAGQARIGGEYRDAPTSITSFQGNTTISNGTWYHVAYMVDVSAAAVNLEVDGTGLTESISPADATSIQNGSAPVSVGALGYLDTSSTSGFSTVDGLLDDVMVFNAQLTSTDVDNYLADPCNWTPPASLKARWRLDNSALDDTANNNDLTDHNTVTYTTDTAYACAAPAAPVGVGTFYWGDS